MPQAMRPSPEVLWRSLFRTGAPSVAMENPVPINFSNADSYPLRGSCSVDGRSVTVQVGSVTASPAPSCASGSWSVTMDVNSVRDAAAVAVVATHENANAVEARSERSVVKDVVRPAGTLRLSGVGTPPFSEAFSIQVRFGERVNSFALEDLTVRGGVASGSVDSAGETFDVTLTPNENVTEIGVLVAENRVEDAAGNGNLAIEEFVVSVDTVSPALAVTEPISANLSVKERSQSISGTCEEDASPVSFGGTGLEGRVVPAPCSQGSFRREITLSVGDGNKEILVSQADMAGNTAEVTLPFVLDQTGPELVVTTPAVGARRVSALSQQIEGTCEDGGSDVSFSGTGLAGTENPVRCWTGRFNLTVTLSAGEGEKSLRISQEDALENEGHVDLILRVDQSPPELTITTPAVAAQSVNTLSQTVAGSCETGRESCAL